MCCIRVTVPPFRLKGDPDPSWDRLSQKLKEEVLAHAEQRTPISRIVGMHWGQRGRGPCLWFDLRTGRCREYDNRPDLCRDYEVGGEACQEERKDAGFSFP